MTSEKLKPTPGIWKAKDRDVYIGRKRVCHHVNAAHPDPLNMQDDWIQAKENARLIAEAGTVFHEFGLSPRELLEAVRDIRSLLEQSTAHIKELCMCYSHPLPEATMGAIYDALAKHKEV